jgi:chloramphenicol-sensitive protein RarD
MTDKPVSYYNCFNIFKKLGIHMYLEDRKLGIIFTALSYLIWGFLPIYWKLVDHVAAEQILAHRIIWSFVFMVLLLFATRKFFVFLTECKALWKSKKKLIYITLASLLVTTNWLIFIWAVNNDHVLQASLGYYINPLISILFGVAILKERLNFWQMVSTILAAIGVLYLTINSGVFPIVSLALAITFALYGLIKKLVPLPAMYSLTIETMIVTPFALIFLLQTNFSKISSFEFSSTAILLIISGVATAVPLLLFGAGAMRIPLSMVGFLQYTTPTIMFILGIILYHEPFSLNHLITFIFIWSASILYILSNTKAFHLMEAKLLKKKAI